MTINPLPRKVWNARPAKRVTPLRWAGVQYAVLHWPASMNVKIGSDKATVARWLRNWQNLHMDNRGWSDIAYSHAVDLAGRLWTLRGWDRVEGGAKNMGGKCVSILAVMGSLDTPTPEMLATIVAWQNEADKHAKRKLTRTYHGKLISTECPGPALTKWAKAGFPINNMDDKMPSLRVGTLNCLDPRFGGSTADSRMKKLADTIESMNAHAVALTECPESMRDRIRPLLPGGKTRWKVWTNGATAILFDATKLIRIDDATIGGTYVSNYHGYIAQSFTFNGDRVTICAYHLQPNKSASYETQIAQVNQAAQAAIKLGGKLVVLAGDGINNDNWLPEWKTTRVGKYAKLPTYHDAITDRIHYRGNYKVSGYGTRTNTGSDHNAAVAKLTPNG